MIDIATQEFNLSNETIVVNETRLREIFPQIVEAIGEIETGQEMV